MPLAYLVVSCRWFMNKEGQKRAEYYYTDVMTAMEGLRTPIDELEMIVDKDVWPMPSYGDLIFEV